MKNLQGHEYYSPEWCQDMRDIENSPYKNLSDEKLTEYHKNAYIFKSMIEPLLIKYKDNKEETNNIWKLLTLVGEYHDKKYNIVYPSLDEIIND